MIQERKKGAEERSKLQQVQGEVDINLTCILMKCNLMKGEAGHPQNETSTRNVSTLFFGRESGDSPDDEKRKNQCNNILVVTSPCIRRVNRLLETFERIFLVSRITSKDLHQSICSQV